MIDFEEAIKQYGPDFHGKHGFPGMMGDLPKKSDAHSKETPEDPIHKILKYQQEQAKKSAESPKMMKTGEGAQVVFEATDAQTGHSKTPTIRHTPTSVADPVPSETSLEELPADDDSSASIAPNSETTKTPVVEDHMSTSVARDEPVPVQNSVSNSDAKEGGTAHVKGEL